MIRVDNANNGKEFGIYKLLKFFMLMLKLIRAISQMKIVILHVEPLKADHMDS